MNNATAAAAADADSRRLWADVATLLRTGAAILLLLGFSITVADPDLWGHVRFGHDIAAARHVPRDDLYSFTSDRSWVNHEWLAELAMYGAYAAAGPHGLMILKIALALATILAIAWEVRRDRPPAVVRDVLLVLAWSALYLRYLAVRPQLFSMLLFTLVLVILREADRGRRAGLFLLPPVVLAWSNLHGGWIVGVAVIELWVGLEVVERGRTPRERITLLGLGAAAAAASLLNPYGIGLWRFLWETVGLSRPDILDWTPLARVRWVLVLPWYLAVVLGVACLIVRGLPRQRSYLAIVLVLGFASWRIVRNDVFFVLSVVLLLVPAATAGWKWPPPLRIKVPGARAVRAIVALLVAGEAVVLAPAYMVAVKCLDVDSNNATAPAPETARFIKVNHLRGRMITWYDWGEYAIWHFSPDIKISFDGRRETVYSDALIAEHLAFFYGRPGGMDLLRRLNPDYVLVPGDLEVVPLLDRAGWARIHSDRTSIIFARPTMRHFEQPPPEAPSRSLRCFPSE